MTYWCVLMTRVQTLHESKMTVAKFPCPPVSCPSVVATMCRDTLSHKAAIWVIIFCRISAKCAHWDIKRLTAVTKVLAIVDTRLEWIDSTANDSHFWPYNWNKMINEYDYENTKAYQNLGTALVCALQLLYFLQSYSFFIREIVKLYIIAQPNFGFMRKLSVNCQE